MHWVNAPFLLVMLWSGLEIYWAYDPYRLGWGDTTLLPLFPDAFYAALGVERHLAEGMAYHFTFGWLFTLNGVAYVLYTALSGEWRHLVPRRLSDLRDAGAGAVVTGLAIYKPVQLGWLTAALGGYQAARLIHFVVAALLVAFVLVHLAQVARAGWSNFRGMVVGYEPAPPDPPAAP
jgi:thiosulfate reductase cytochrome b subunit